MSSINIQDFLNRAWRRASTRSGSTQGGVGAFPEAAAGPSSTSPAVASTSQHPSILPQILCRFPLIPSPAIGDIVGHDAKFEKVCGFLSDADVGIVGIYGMGGVGKTTVMKIVHNNFLVRCYCDLILWVAVTKEWNYDKIREDIIKRIRGLGIFDLDLGADAMELYNFLLGKRFFVLLDDVWEHLDLIELGVPIPTKTNMCKIIFTTRSEDVCQQMRTDKKIKIDCLGPNDSWALFEKNVGEKALKSHSIVAHQVMNECCGLPLALIIVGRAMSSKYALKEWEHALEILQNNPYRMPGVEKKLFSCLEFSYLSLEEDTSRKCFLYCSLFPEDFSIQKEKLVDYWIGEGFLGKCENLEQLRNRGFHIIGGLLAACLIENGTDAEEKEVKMHDVIRDMALWIVSYHGAEKNKFFVHPGHRLTSSEILHRWNAAERIFVQYINELPKLPSCPVLTTLIFDKDAHLAGTRNKNDLGSDRANILVGDGKHIKGEGPSSDPDMEPNPEPNSSHVIEMTLDDTMSSLFQSMPNLRLLELSLCLLSDLPKAVMELPKLRYLSSGAVKYLSPKVRRLSSLEILDLSCSIKPAADSPFLANLPDAIAQLLDLRILNLKGMWLKSLPQETGFLSKLEILDLSNTPIFELSTGIQGLRELRQLKLSGTMLRSLPEEVIYLSKLEVLDLSKTEISELPWRIYWLSMLRLITLENTLLAELPKELFYLSKLEVLNLSNSKITNLPIMIGRLSELRQLYLKKLFLYTLPEAVGSLFKLEVLNLSGSNIAKSSMAVWMGKLTKLEILDLSFTSIFIIPNTISSLVELRQLNLENTLICRLPEEMMILSKLEVLNLNNTRTEELPTWINQLQQLKELHLCNTRVKELPRQVSDLSKLEILNLKTTNIKEVPTWIYKLSKLREFNHSYFSDLPTSDINLHTYTRPG